MVAIFSVHQAEVQALRRDLYMTRMALTQAGISRVGGSGDANIVLVDEDIAADGRSGVESTTSEISWEVVVVLIVIVKVIKIM